MAHHVDDVCGGGCVCVGDRRNSRTIPIKKPMGWEFFVPNQTLTGVFLLMRSLDKTDGEES